MSRSINLGGHIIPTKARCYECSRVFDLLNEDDAAEWYYGHDCEDQGQENDDDGRMRGA